MACTSLHDDPTPAEMPLPKLNIRVDAKAVLRLSICDSSSIKPLPVSLQFPADSSSLSFIRLDLSFYYSTMPHLPSIFLLSGYFIAGINAAIGPVADLHIVNKVIAPDGYSRE